MKGANNMRYYVEQAVKDWNEYVDKFMTEELPTELIKRGVSVKDGKIALNDWFKAQEIIKNSKIHEIGWGIMEVLRDQGYDVKMNMQDNKLVYHKH